MRPAKSVVFAGVLTLGKKTPRERAAFRELWTETELYYLETDRLNIRSIFSFVAWSAD